MTTTNDVAAANHPAARQILWTETSPGRFAYQVDTLIMRQAMIRAGKRQVDIARGADLSQSMVGDILCGRRQPSEKALKAISEVLSIAPQALLLRTPNASHSADVQTTRNVA